MDAIPDEINAAKLTLIEEPEGLRGGLQIDNYGSRFIGPYEAIGWARAMIVPGQTTTAQFVLVNPAKELIYGSLRQRVALLPGLQMELFGDYSRAQPGHTLKALNVKSTSWTASLNFVYRLIRQRNENLQIEGSLRVYNADTEILGVPVSRDRIRPISVGLRYSADDDWNGIVTLAARVTQGLPVPSARPSGATNVSRPQAKAAFTKLELEFNRQQPLGVSGFVLDIAAAGQVASGPLYASEEIGYGGAQFGRAYDPSEITGDHGLMGAVELRYDALNLGDELRVAPYALFEIGRVWNDDIGSTSPDASDAGFGIRLDTGRGITMDVTVSKPLTRGAGAPQGSTGMSPRYLFRSSFAF